MPVRSPVRALAGALVLLGFVAPVVGRPTIIAQGAPERITLAEALDRSEATTPSIIQAQGALRSAELSVRTSKLQYIPQLSFPVGAAYNVSSGQSRLDPVTGQIIGGSVTNPSYSVGARASLTLFDGFNRERTLSAAEAREDAAVASITSTIFQNRLTVTNAFFDALANEELLKVSEAAVTRAQQQLAVASARLQSGAGQLTDSLSALVQAGQARQQLLNAQASLATAEANLGRLVGEDHRVAAVDDSSFYVQPVLLDTAGVRIEAIAASPAVQTSEANLEAARQQLRASKSGYWPTVTASASSDWTANKFNDYSLEPRRNFLLQMSFSPWSNLQRETQVENASIALDNQIAQVADQKRQISAQMTQQFASLGNARESIDVAQLSVGAAAENVRITEQRYRLGVATIFDLLQAQEQLTSAQVSEIQARYSYLRAKSQIEALIGRRL
ncbi:MAG: TolC family protein [Gemmatimonadota bacterium]